MMFTAVGTWPSLRPLIVISILVLFACDARTRGMPELGGGVDFGRANDSAVGQADAQVDTNADGGGGPVPDASLGPDAGDGATPTGPGVYAHYMAYLHVYARSVEGFKKEIRDAQSIGLDGFTIFIGDWDQGRQDVASMMLRAADELGSGFKIFFAPAGSRVPAADLQDMIRRFGWHPSYLKWDGKPVLNPWQGTTNGPAWWRDRVVEPMRREGKEFFLMPWFWQIYDRKDTALSNVTRLHHDFVGVVDASYWWGAGRRVFGDATTPWYDDMILVSETFAQVTRRRAIPYVGAYVTEFWGTCKGNNASLPGGGFHGRRWGHDRPMFIELRGGEGIARQWLSNIHDTTPEALIIATWNDFGEGHYLTPAAQPPSWGWAPKIVSHPHQGHAELSKYYLQWYKTGRQPAITRDGAFFFYRTHPKGIAPPFTDQCPTIEMDIDPKTEDKMYVTTMLAAPGQVVINSGGNVRKLSVAAGIQHVSTDFSVGSQVIELWRNGLKLGQKHGAVVESAPVTRNYNVYSGYFYAQ